MVNYFDQTTVGECKRLLVFFEYFCMYADMCVRVCARVRVHSNHIRYDKSEFHSTVKLPVVGECLLIS